MIQGAGRVPQFDYHNVTERQHIPIYLHLKSIAQCDGRSIDRRLRRTPFSSPVGAVTSLTPSAASPGPSACTPSGHLGPPRECCRPFRFTGLCISKVTNMASGVDLLMYFNTSCVECSDMGPPPDTILGIPPPPLPAFLQRAPVINNTSTCSVLCDWTAGPGVEYVELPRHGPAMDDTWLLVLIASSVGVLLLGALLALFLLKCRVERSGKGSLQLDGSSLSKTKGVKGCEAVLYPCSSSGGAITPDSRVLWAALTPRGTTHHFTAEPPIYHQPYHHNIPQYGSTLQHQARSLPPIPTSPQHQSPHVSPYQITQITQQLPDALPVSFDNSGFIDSDDPTPVVESYQLSELTETASMNSMRRTPCGSPHASPRPRVSSPTRIEHPNLPPLNLHPSHRGLRRTTLSRRESDASSVSSPVVL